MKRTGKFFEYGYPHFFKGVEYNLPNQDIDIDKAISSSKQELGDFLLEKTRGYMNEFSGESSRAYPYLQVGVKGLALHIGDGGRWIEVWKMIGPSFLGEHNLDSYKDRMIAFNIGSDTIEFFDKTILTPRITKNNKGFLVNYPLPENQAVIPDSKYYHLETLTRLYQISGLSSEIEFEKEKDLQKIISKQGKIKISNSNLEVSGFEKWDLAKASWVAARIMSLCNPDFV